MKTILWILLILAISFQNNQAKNPEWVNYTSNYVKSMVKDGDFIWTGGDGLCRINTLTGEKTFYNHANSGLPDNEIFSMALGGNNNLWISTRNGGLVQFDGINWTVTPSNLITLMSADKSNNLWVPTGDGIAKFDGKDWTYFKTTIALYQNFYKNCLFIDSNDVKWIGTDSGAIKVIGTDWYHYHKLNSGLQDNNISNIAKDKSNNIWFSTNKGLTKFDGVTYVNYDSTNTPVKLNLISSFMIDTDDIIWVALWDGSLIKYQNNQWSTIINNDKNKLSLPYRKLIKNNSQGLLALSSEHELFNFNSKSSYWAKEITSNCGMNGNSVSFLKIDNENNKWFYNYGGVSFYYASALNKLNLNNIIVYDTSNSDIHSNLISTISIINNKIWLGVVFFSYPTNEKFPSGLNIFDGISWNFLNQENSGLPEYSVSSIALDSNQNYFIGTYGGGLHSFDGNKWKQILFPDSLSEGNYIRNLTTDKTNNLWFSLRRGNSPIPRNFGLIQFDGINWMSYRFSSDSMPAPSIGGIGIDKFNNKWVCTSNGLQKYDNLQWSRYDSLDWKLSTNSINEIAIDSKDNKWIGSDKGLIKYDNVNWTYYTIDNSGLGCEIIYTIAVDKEDNIYISTYMGISVYREGGVSDYVLGPISGVESKDNHKLTDECISISPNPITNQTIIKYSIDFPSQIKLFLLNSLGQEIAILDDGIKEAGEQTLSFSSDEYNLPDGLYFIRLVAGEGVYTEKMIILK